MYSPKAPILFLGIIYNGSIASYNPSLAESDKLWNICGRNCCSTTAAPCRLTVSTRMAVIKLKNTDDHCIWCVLHAVLFPAIKDVQRSIKYPAIKWALFHRNWRGKFNASPTTLRNTSCSVSVKCNSSTAEEKRLLVFLNRIYPYKDSWERLTDPWLPTKEASCSKITVRHISAKDYLHPQKVWTVFRSNNLED